MRFTFRAKLLAIVGTTALAFVVLIGLGEATSRRVADQLETVQTRYLPMLELGPQLDADLERLQRGFQDAVAAQDLELLAHTEEMKEQLLTHLARAKDGVDPAEASRLRAAIDTYHQTAQEVSKRLIAGQTGEAMVDEMSRMQARHAEAARQLERTTHFDHSKLTEAFEALRTLQSRTTAARTLIDLLCFAVVLALSLLISRGVLRSLASLSAGLERYGAGDFEAPIAKLSADELGDVAERANQMAASLKHAKEEREAADWQKTGQAKLMTELQGELESEETGKRALSSLARHLGALAGALYLDDGAGTLSLIAEYAGTGSPRAFRRGEGLIGEAATRGELIVVDRPPPDYLRIRSGLGETAARSIVLLPILHLGKVIAVLELALLDVASEATRDFLSANRDVLAVALDLAKTRKLRRELFAETEMQAEQLRGQEEELRLGNEELQAQQEELRNANDELQKKTIELEKVSSYKSQFLSNMSHELRTPLNSMLLLSSLLAENESKNLTEKQVEYSKTILSAGRDLLELINQVLDLAKIESGKQSISVERVSLAELADRAARVHGPMAKNKGLLFRMELDPGAPAEIRSDRQRLEQILTNLIGNAIKFTERGEVVLRIHRPGPGWVMLSVRDTGIGIPERDQQRIFSPFEQVDAKTQRRYGGTGLGLAIVRELVALLGGTLALDSVPGRGSTFTITVPDTLRAPEGRALTEDLPVAPPITPITPITPATEAAAHLENGRGSILLIEDDLIFAERVAEVAADAGLHVMIAKDGETGVNLARAHLPRGIILDIRLPDIDGIEVMNRLRAHRDTRAIPVHFISALDVRERGMAMGAIGYLRKPVTKQDLTMVLESLAPPNTPARVLVLEGTAAFGESVVELLESASIDARRARGGEEALAALGSERYACIILDLALPDTDALTLLEELHRRADIHLPPVIVYTDRALKKEEVRRLEAYTESVVVREGSSNERLLEEARLFVRKVKAGEPARRAAIVDSAHTRDINFEGKKLLVADDDMRTVYALSALLRAKGAEVFVADNGRTALEVLSKHPDLHAVLIDIMMPEMDGYEAMRRIRALDRFRDLPLIALTAKAMKGDHAKCLEAGASDYMSKPIDADRILSLLHAWLSGAGVRSGVRDDERRQT